MTAKVFIAGLDTLESVSKKAARAEPTDALKIRFSEAVDKAKNGTPYVQTAQASLPTAPATRVEAAPTATTTTPLVSSTASVPTSANNPLSSPTNIDTEEQVQRAQQTNSLKSARAPTIGDAVLAGLQKLRGTFTAHEVQLHTIASQPISTETMYAMQKEIHKLTLLTDVTSKLTNKAISTIDTLMKG